MSHGRAALAAITLGVCAFAPGAARAAPEWFQIDPVHTRVLFFVEHARFSRSIGLFKGVEGGFWFDEDDWSAGRVDLCLPLETLDMGDRAWTQRLMRPDFLDATRAPQACFRSTRVERLDEKRGTAHGEFRVRDVAQPGRIEFTVNDLRRYSLTLKRRIGISATATLSRGAFGITRDSTLIGDTVEIMIELEAQRADPPRPPGTTED